MVGEGIQNYVDMAAGLTEATKAKARAAAKSLLATAGLEEVAADATDRATKLAEEVLAASRANRELMIKLVAAEVDRAAGRLGFVRSEELDELRRELAEVRMSMAHASAHDPAPFAAGLGVPDPPAPVDPLVEPDEPPTIDPIAEPGVATPEAPATRARIANKAAAKRAPAKKAPVEKGAAKQAPAGGSAASKVAAGKTPATVAKVAAKKVPAKKVPAKKAAPTTAAEE